MSNEFFHKISDSAIEFLSFTSVGASAGNSAGDLAAAIRQDSSYNGVLGADGKPIFNSVKLMTDVVSSIDVLVRPIAEMATIDPLTGASRPTSTAIGGLKVVAEHAGWVGIAFDTTLMLDTLSDTTKSDVEKASKFEAWSLGVISTGLALAAGSALLATAPVTGAILAIAAIGIGVVSVIADADTEHALLTRQLSPFLDAVGDALQVGKAKFTAGKEYLVDLSSKAAQMGGDIIKAGRAIFNEKAASILSV